MPVISTHVPQQASSSNSCGFHAALNCAAAVRCVQSSAFTCDRAGAEYLYDRCSAPGFHLSSRAADELRAQTRVFIIDHVLPELAARAVNPGPAAAACAKLKRQLQRQIGALRATLPQVQHLSTSVQLEPEAAAASVAPVGALSSLTPPADSVHAATADAHAAAADVAVSAAASSAATAASGAAAALTEAQAVARAGPLFAQRLLVTQVVASGLGPSGGIGGKKRIRASARNSSGSSSSSSSSSSDSDPDSSISRPSQRSPSQRTTKGRYRDKEDMCNGTEALQAGWKAGSPSPRLLGARPGASHAGELAELSPIVEESPTACRSDARDEAGVSDSIRPDTGDPVDETGAVGGKAGAGRAVRDPSPCGLTQIAQDISNRVGLMDTPHKAALARGLFPCLPPV